MEDESSLKGLAILVVDDNATNRKILERSSLYSVMIPTVVESAAAGLLAMENALNEGNPFPVVITDCMIRNGWLRAG